MQIQYNPDTMKILAVYSVKIRCSVRPGDAIFADDSDTIPKGLEIGSIIAFIDGEPVAVTPAPDPIPEPDSRIEELLALLSLRPLSLPELSELTRLEHGL